MMLQIIDWQDPLWSKTLQGLRYDVYHLPEYLYIESKRTQSIPEAFLLIDGDNVFFVPYLLRRCADITNFNLRDELFDVVSPYGYPGILLSNAATATPGFPGFALNALKQEFMKRKICSAFFRLHPILNQQFNEFFQPGTFSYCGETVSIDLTLPEAESWFNMNRGHRSPISKCRKLGFTSRIISLTEHIQEFIDIYKESMNRLHAKDAYYFDYDYFDHLSKLGSHVHLGLVELDGQIANACVFFECCGIVQAHLTGTRNEFLSLSPFKLQVDHARFWFKQRGNKYLHLGGGVGGTNDKLFEFKAGFSPQRFKFSTLRMILDEENYQYLVKLQASNLNTQPEFLLEKSFFPAYRFNG